VLQKEIIGQDLAIEALMQEVVAIGTKAEAVEGPVGVFLFTGPTGTGKTYTAECLGKAVFRDDRNAVIRFNMNEFKERHEIARLIGAPPGFVGHDQLGALFKFAEGNPQGLIILDEMEKAHPEIQDYFLQIFDKGEAQDSRGRKVDLRPYIFIMTCNLVTGPARTRIGFGVPDDAQNEVRKSSTHEVLSQHFRNEFLARIRRIIEFQKFGREGYLALLQRNIVVLVEKLEREHSIYFQMTDTAKSQFTDTCIDQTDGCRGFKRLFDRLISIPAMAYANDNSKILSVTLTEFVDGQPIF
jgi:ATP-dependent Clp protease ATP-binding subunit ClpA